MKIKPEDVKAAEMSALACALVDPATAGDILAHLTESDFIRPENKALYSAIKAISERGEGVDIVTVDAELRGDGAYLAAGGIDYLIEMGGFLPSAVNLESYMALVAANGREKRIADALRIIYASNEEAMPQLEALMEREQKARKPIGGDNPLGEQIVAFIESLENPDASQRIRTGIPTLDDKTGGLPKKSVSIVGARPGVGKTDIMLNWSTKALDDLHRVAVFSLEMPVEQLLERYAAAMARVNYSLINQKRVKDAAGRALIGGKLVDLMKGDRLSLIDDVNTITGIVSEIARLKPDIAFVDYMSIVEPEQKYRDARHREIAEITRAIKKAAKKYNCHICVLAQLTRDAADREPTKADLREAGAQEEQFDIVLLLHRPPFWKEDSKHPGDRRYGLGDHLAALIMDKNKYGKVARLKLNFDGAHQQFTESEVAGKHDSAREPGDD